MWGNYPYLDVKDFGAGNKELTLDIGAFARLMRVKKLHIAEYLEWLDSMGYLTLTSCDTKKATVILDIPPLFGKCI